jgi:hypothetical protein
LYGTKILNHKMQRKLMGIHFKHKTKTLLGVVVHACKASTWAVEVGGLEVQGQPGLYNQITSQKKKNNKHSPTPPNKGRECRAYV